MNSTNECNLLRHTKRKPTFYCRVISNRSTDALHVCVFCCMVLCVAIQHITALDSNNCKCCQNFRFHTSRDKWMQTIWNIVYMYFSLLLDRIVFDVFVCCAEQCLEFTIFSRQFLNFSYFQRVARKMSKKKRVWRKLQRIVKVHWIRNLPSHTRIYGIPGLIVFISYMHSG